MGNKSGYATEMTDASHIDGGSAGGGMYGHRVNTSNGSAKPSEDVFGGAGSLADMKKQMNLA